MKQYELHPLCTYFPRMAGAEFDALREDIRANGQREPIVLHDGMILDGGNRYQACLDADIEPIFKAFDGDNIVSYVLSVNLHRRHLSAGQHAAIVASVTNWATAHKRGGDRKSDQSAMLHFDSVADRAAASGASIRTQKDADKVAKADPALAVEVGQGKTTLAEAKAKIDGKARKAKKSPEPKIKAPEPDDDALSEAFGNADSVLDDLQRDLESARADLAAALADDQKAETVKWRRMAELAQRRQSELMETVNAREKELQRVSKLLQRIGKLFDERDTSKVPALVEAFYRQHAKRAA